MAKPVKEAAGSAASGRLAGTGGVELYWREWKAGSADKKATILFVHGLGEHCGRYEAFGTYFASRGVPVVSFDLRGHGQSAGQRGHIDRFDDYVKDVMIMRDFVGKRHPGDKIALIGHSLGGLIVLAAAEEHGDAFPCVVASAPLLGIALKVPGWKAAVGKAMSTLAPKLSMTNEINPEFLARNPEVGRRYVADPLVGNKVSARWFVETVLGMERTMAGAGKLAIPALVMQATEDRLVAAEGSRAFAGTKGPAKKDFQSYEGWYHELFQEDEREQAFAAIWKWLGGLGLV